MSYDEVIAQAFEEAIEGMNEGGLPIGAILIDNDGSILGRGRNRRVQHSDPTAHAEVEAFRQAGRRNDYSTTTMLTTLTPCFMCSGLIIQFGIPRVVIGDGVHFRGGIDLLRQHGVEIIVANSSVCVHMFDEWIKANPELVEEDGARGSINAATEATTQPSPIIK